MDLRRVCSGRRLRLAVRIQLEAHRLLRVGIHRHVEKVERGCSLTYADDSLHRHC